jgi:hypothetical protein
VAEDGDYAVEETERRRDEALRRALNTPPQHRPAKNRESKPDHPVSAAKRGKRGQAASES